MSFKDHFSSQAASYARYRPDYPDGLFAALAALAPARDLAWDCGAGNGQASTGLARHFGRVLATEPSAAQRAAAAVHPRVTYAEGAEAAPGLADGSVDLATAAQAAHWFDLPRYYAELDRVLRPGGAVALWTYALCVVTPEVDAIVRRFYTETVGPFWPPERVHTENGYRSFPFPFEERAFPPFEMERLWTAAEFGLYLRTWSSVVRYARTHGTDPVEPLEAELAPVWGPGVRRVSWLIAGRLGHKPGPPLSPPA